MRLVGEITIHENWWSVCDLSADSTNALQAPSTKGPEDV